MTVKVERKRLEASGSVVIDLPMPPGVNHLYPTGAHGKRFRSDEYESWLRTASQEIMVQRPRCLIGPVEIEIELEDRPRKYDPDGKIKAIMDCLVKNGIIDDDNHKIVRKITTSICGCSGARIGILRAGAKAEANWLARNAARRA